MSRPAHDVTNSSRARELHELANEAGVHAPASLAYGLAALEGEGWRVVSMTAASGDEVALAVTKTARPTPRDEVAARIRTEREQGRSLRTIARGLERDAVPAPRGGLCWSPTTVLRVGGLDRLD